MFAAAAGCGGHNGASVHDAATDGAANTVTTDAPSTHDASNTGTTDAPSTHDAANTVTTDAPSADGPTNIGTTDAPSTYDASSTVTTDAPSTEGPTDSAMNDDATEADGLPDVATTGDGGPDDSSPAIPSITVIAGQNQLTLDTCNVTQALLADIPAGSYTIQLAASTLSKGSVSGTPQLPAVDNYVLVNLPLSADDPQHDRRFFMLNGVGATADVTLTTTGTIGLMFLDSDVGANNGQATITLTPGGYSATVDAVTNVLRWQEGCQSTPAALVVTSGAHRATLVASTLSAGPGSRDDYVLLRVPSEQPTDDHRFVVLNGVGASDDFTPYNSQTVRAWFVSASSGASGQATVEVSDL